MRLSLHPSTLFIQVTSECNSRCRYCHMWTLQDDPAALTTDEKVTVLKQFRELSENGQVVLTGGETMLKHDEFFALIRHCRTLGLKTAANTNGSLISAQDYETILTEGPDYLVFSVDSHDAALHDYHRGLPGSLKATVATISGLISVRSKSLRTAPVEIITNSVVSRDTIEGLFDLLSFLKDLGVDGATLQILSPTFHLRGGRDVFYERHFFNDKPRAVELLQCLRNRLLEYPVLRVTDTDLRWMQAYIDGPMLLDEGVCNSHERNIMVDHRGDVQLCFDMRQIFDGRPIGNVRSASLDKLWSGKRAAAARGVMEECRRTCGMLNCHRRPS